MKKVADRGEKRATGRRDRFSAEAQSPHPNGRSLEAPVARPKSSTPGQQDRGKQVSTDIADAEPEEQVPIDEVKNFPIGRDTDLRQVVQRPQNEIAPR
jgi:hypothetical protein